MKTFILSALAFVLLIGASTMTQEKLDSSAPEMETSYDEARNETTAKFPRIKIAGESRKYYSLHSIVSYKYPGRTQQRPQFLTFELQTIVRGRKLNPDLYVQLLIDGEKVFLSSNRWAERNVVPGKPWLSEHIALRMPYAVFVRITEAKEFAIQLGAVTLIVGEKEKERLRAFGAYLRGVETTPIRGLVE